MSRIVSFLRRSVFAGRARSALQPRLQPALLTELRDIERLEHMLAQR